MRHVYSTYGIEDLYVWLKNNVPSILSKLTKGISEVRPVVMSYKGVFLTSCCESGQAVTISVSDFRVFLNSVGFMMRSA